MSHNSKLREYFVRLPKCNSDGSNYIMYRDRFKYAVDAAGLGDHIDPKKSAPREPIEPMPVPVPAPAPPPAQDNAQGGNAAPQAAAQPAPQLTEEQCKDFGQALVVYCMHSQTGILVKQSLDRESLVQSLTHCSLSTKNSRSVRCSGRIMSVHRLFPVHEMIERRSSTVSIAAFSVTPISGAKTATET